VETTPIIPCASVLRLQRSVGKDGAVVFHNNCLVCHSLEPGQNGYGPSLAGYFKRNLSQTVDQTQQLIRNGRRRMPPFRDRLSSDQIQDVIAYIRTQ
jgi:mono/diheme cytochrome c family protein